MKGISVQKSLPNSGLNRSQRIAGPNEEESPERNCPLNLAIGCVFRDEARFLREWIEFHRLMGVQRFYLVDDRSDDDYRDVVGPYVDEGVVQVFERPCPPAYTGRRWIQYQHIVLGELCRELRGVTRWLALVDADEFLVPTAAPTVLDFLADYEAAGAVHVEWRMFGTSGVRRLGAGELLTERMCRRMATRPNPGKSVVKPHRVAEAGIHRCALEPGHAYVSAPADPSPGRGGMRVHHYWTRDEEFLLATKLPRTADVKGWELTPEAVDFHRTAYGDVEDRLIERFLPGLRERLGHHRTPRT
ncbi:glycosyltransferase family 92 protein [Streptomyces sp. NPDC002463]|uniref:glycosyltransferase family 92 protein n=1 Tax=Streptomyces sp. NPDC002463 TaxID=3364645 RepID=UPI0036A2C270